MTAIPLGRGSPHRLGATYPHTRRAGSVCAYGVLLRVEIARFTRPSGLRPESRRACAPPARASRKRPSFAREAQGFGDRLVSVALILTSRWTAVSCYAALCSPDLPPARPFGPCASGGLACFTAVIIRPLSALPQAVASMSRQASVSPPHKGLSWASPKGRVSGTVQALRCNCTVPELRFQP